MRLWLALGGMLALIAALAGAYFYGRGDGAAIERDKQAAVERAVAKERAAREQTVDSVGGGAAAAEQARAAGMREIYHETQTVVERPVYRNVCIDADGVRLVDRAAAIANGDDPGGGSAKAGETAGPAAPPRRDDGRQGGAAKPD